MAVPFGRPSFHCTRIGLRVGKSQVASALQGESGITMQGVKFAGGKPRRRTFSAPRGVRPWGKQRGKRHRKTYAQILVSLSASPPPLLHQPAKPNKRQNKLICPVSNGAGAKAADANTRRGKFPIYKRGKRTKMHSVSVLTCKRDFRPLGDLRPFPAEAARNPTTAGKARNAKAPRYPK